MIAIDTNLLVYSHREATPEHKAAQQALQRAAQNHFGWGISTPVLAEFWSVVTHPSCSGGPSTATQAHGFVAALTQAGARLWTPNPGSGERLLATARDLEIEGTRIFDLQIALIAAENGAKEIWTHDQKFLSLPGLHVRDPL